MTNNPANLIIMIVLAAFVIDRLVTASLFLLSFVPAWTQRIPDPLSIDEPDRRRQAEKRRKFSYFLLAGILAAAFLGFYRNVGVLAALGFQSEASSESAASPSPSPSPAANATGVAAASPSPNVKDQTKPGRTFGDSILTWLILIGGAENIAKLLKGYGESGGGKSESQPIEITGKLTLEERSEKKAEG